MEITIKQKREKDNKMLLTTLKFVVGGVVAAKTVYDMGKEIEHKKMSLCEKITNKHIQVLTICSQEYATLIGKELATIAYDNASESLNNLKENTSAKKEDWEPLQERHLGEITKIYKKYMDTPTGTKLKL